MTEGFDWQNASMDEEPFFHEHIRKVTERIQTKLHENIEEQLLAMLFDGGPGVAYGTFIEEPYTIVAMTVRHPSVPFGEMQDHTQHLRSRRDWDDFITNG